MEIVGNEGQNLHLIMLDLEADWTRSGFMHFSAILEFNFLFTLFCFNQDV